MKVTYFIRNNNNAYPEICDVASIKIEKATKIYYFGCQWGEHNPTDVINYIITEPNILNSTDWLSSLGYKIVEQQIS